MSLYLSFVACVLFFALSSRSCGARCYFVAWLDVLVSFVGDVTMSQFMYRRDGLGGHLCGRLVTTVRVIVLVDSLGTFCPWGGSFRALLCSASVSQLSSYRSRSAREGNALGNSLGHFAGL